MGLNIKNIGVEQLASEVAALTHESKTEAIRQALLERRLRLRARGNQPEGPLGLRHYFEQNVWPLIPQNELGRVLSPD
jgi:antitoxin VapB